MIKIKKIGTALFILGLLCVGCSQQVNETGTDSYTETTIETLSEDIFGVYADEDRDASWDAISATKIVMENTTSTSDGNGVQISGSKIMITSAGTYLISGNLDDGQIVVAANADTDVVRLVLNGATINNSTSSGIYVEQAEKTIIILAEGTENTITDASTYQYADTATGEPDAAIFSKDDLSLTGAGKLTVKGNYNNGIRSKDDLVITDGVYDITAVNNGLKGKDSISILKGTFTLTTNGDGIQANNAEEPEKGWVAVDGGIFEITAGTDGIQAETSIKISNGNFTIQTGTGMAGTPNDIESYKGLKSSGAILTTGGTFDLNTQDDAIHTNGDVTIDGGSFQIATGDDGIHADNTLTISGGNIDIKESYEGIEGANIIIIGGETTIISTDDGMNAAGGNDSAQEERPDQFAVAGNYGITISGGYTIVDAAGDGIDSNGNISMSAGTLLVHGPTDNGNASLDYDGEYTLTGGILVAAGSSGMAQTPSETSEQSIISLYFNSNQVANTLVNVKNAAGEDILTFSPIKGYSHIIVSTPDLVQGQSYTISTGGTHSGTNNGGIYTQGEFVGTKLLDVTLSNSITSISETGAAVSGGMMGGGLPRR